MIGLKPSILDRANSCLALVAALSSLVVVGCGGPSTRDVVGTYWRTTPAASETLKVKADGTFTQVVQAVDGRVWTLADKWVLKPRGVTFNLFYETYDLEKQAAMIPPLKGAFRNFGWKEGLLMFSEEGSYNFQRTRKN